MLLLPFHVARRLDEDEEHHAVDQQPHQGAEAVHPQSAAEEQELAPEGGTALTDRERQLDDHDQDGCSFPAPAEPASAGQKDQQCAQKRPENQEEGENGIDLYHGHLVIS